MVILKQSNSILSKDRRSEMVRKETQVKTMEKYKVKLDLVRGKVEYLTMLERNKEEKIRKFMSENGISEVKFEDEDSTIILY